MRRYQFTGHLTPLPPGIKIPLELSGEIYLVSEVEQELKQREIAYGRENARLNALNVKLLDKVKKLRDRLAHSANEIAK